MKIVSAYAGRSILATVALVSLFSVHTAVAQDAVEFIKIDEGVLGVCGLRSDGTAACTWPNYYNPILPPELPAIKDLAINKDLLCVVTREGDLACYGPAASAFGLDSPPVTGAPYQSVDVGEAHACAINRDDAIECWGISRNNRLDAPAGQFAQLSLGVQSACAVDFAGDVVCWGANDDGNTDVPADLPAASKVEAGSRASCALLQDQSIRCWGRLRASIAGPFKDFSLGGGYGICGVEFDGDLTCTEYDFFFGAVSEEDTYTISTGNPDPRVAVSVVRVCYTNADGDVECTDGRFGLSLDPDVPSENIPAVTGLRSSVYSSTTAELFWDSPEFPWLIARHEIQRNGEVVAFTDNLNSYLVDDLADGMPETFAVRQVLKTEEKGLFSNVITVYPFEQGSGGPSYVPPPRASDGGSIFAYTLCSETAPSLDWVFDFINGEEVLYEIYRNNQYIGFTESLSFNDNSGGWSMSDVYHVLAVDKNNPVNIFGALSSSVDSDDDAC